MAKVEAIVLSLAPEEADSGDEEPRELWRHAKVVQYGNKLSGDPDDAKIKPFVKAYNRRKMRTASAARRGTAGKRRDSTSSIEASTDSSLNDDNRETQHHGKSDNNATTTNKGTTAGAIGTITSGSGNNNKTRPKTKTFKSSKQRFRSRYGNTLRTEDAVGPGFKVIRRTARVLHGAVRFNVSTPFHLKLKKSFQHEEPKLGNTNPSKGSSPQPASTDETKEVPTKSSKVLKKKKRGPIAHKPSGSKESVKDESANKEPVSQPPASAVPKKLQKQIAAESQQKRPGTPDSAAKQAQSPSTSSPIRVPVRRGSAQQEFKSFHLSLKLQQAQKPGDQGNAKGQTNKDKDKESAGNNNNPDPPSPHPTAEMLRLRRRSSSIGRSLNALASQVARNKSKRRHSKEELYTDKDRAAAVALGSKDIKQSLHKQKGLNQAYTGFPEEAGFTICYTQGEHNLKNGDSKLALSFLNKALAIDASNCNCLIARSKCYLQLGDHAEALKDAEAALKIDPNSYKAIYQKAEALYARGDFELALVFYCRGAQARKEMDCFRLGVQKAQEAISNVVGRPDSLKHESVHHSENADEAPPVPQNMNKGKKKHHGQNGGRRKTNTANDSLGRGSARALLGRLHNDMEYLENLLNHPGLRPVNIPSEAIAAVPQGGAAGGSGRMSHDKNKTVSSQVKEALGYLKARQEFWLQQKPITSGRHRSGSTSSNSLQK